LNSGFRATSRLVSRKLFDLNSREQQSLMAKKQPQTASRKHFGKKEAAWIIVEASEDGESAFLRGMCFGGDNNLELEDLVKVLNNQYGITTGINGDVLGRILKQALADPDREYFGKGDLVIASRVPPIPSQDGEILKKYLDRVTGRVELPHTALRESMEQPVLAGVLSQDVRVRAVRPGDELAVIIPPVNGSPAQDIFGNSSSMARTPKRAYLRAGPNVVREENAYKSKIFGYVCETDGQILVISPIWISADGAEAHFIHFPQVGSQVVPQPEWLDQLIQLQDIRVEMPTRDFNSLTRFLVDNRARKGSFALARGKSPEAGKNAQLACKFSAITDDMESRDLSKLSSSAVEENQLIAEIQPPTIGIPGENLNGEEIPAADGTMQEFHAGENVRVELEEGQPKYFYAEISGNAYVITNTISVNSVLHIEGDIDASSGDINAVKDLTVSGSIKAGAKVSAAGSITVGECIQVGAVVRAKGDVIASQGILGNDTRVISLGSVETRFVQSSTIMARNNVTVIDHLFNATVRAGGDLVVHSGSGERSGSIVGGEAYASSGIQAEIVGSPSSNKTIVGIATDLGLEAKRRKVTENIEFCDTNLLRIFRTLGVQSFEASQIKTLLKKTPPWRQKSTVELLMKTKDLVAYKEQLCTTEKGLLGTLQESIRDATVIVNQKAFSDVQIKIGASSKILTEDVGTMEFIQQDEEISLRDPQAAVQVDEIEDDAPEN